jgi:hypothetical protein
MTIVIEKCSKSVKNPRPVECERARKGQQIAASNLVRQKGALWTVPSQAGDGRYTVDLAGPAPRCNCSDHEMRRVKCKHIYAVEFIIAREVTRTEEVKRDGSRTVTTTVKEVKTARVTYKQNWSAYNAAQTHETERFLELRR